MNLSEGAWKDAVTLIVNVRSRRGQELIGPATSALRARGLTVRAHGTQSPHEVSALLGAEVARGARLVVVGGGDGTLSQAANLLARSETAMGVLPLGTGNTFARSVGVPLDLAGAVDVIAQGRVEAVDVGLVNGRVFLNSVALGLSAEIARAMTGELKRRLGLLAWPWLGVGILRRHDALDVIVRYEGQARRYRTHQLIVANGRYVAGPLRATARASVADGQLDVLAFGGSGLLSFGHAGLRWASGCAPAQLAVTGLDVTSPARQHWASVDGEVVEATPLTLSLAPRALRVVVPRSFDAGQA